MNNFFLKENLQNLCKNNPDSILFAHLGARLVEEKEYQKAVELCQKGLEKHPDYAFGHYILGLAYYYIKNYTEAKRELETALSHDPSSPKAWEVLSTVNEILNLNDDANESNLNAYLIDYFNKDASATFLPGEEKPELHVPQPAKSKGDATPQDMSRPDAEEKLEEDLDQILDDVVSTDDNEYDFEKTLDEVFKTAETEPQPRPTEEQESDRQEPPKAPEQQQPSEPDLVPKEDKEGLVTADEFTAAIESFFSDYESEQEPQGVPGVELDESGDQQETSPEVESEKTAPPDLPEEITQQVRPDHEEDLSGDLKSATDEDQPQETEEVVAGDQIFPKENSEEELIDISSMVSDIIEDTEQESSPEVFDASQLEGMPTESDFDEGTPTPDSTAPDSEKKFSEGEQVDEESSIEFPPEKAKPEPEPQDTFETEVKEQQYGEPEIPQPRQESDEPIQVGPPGSEEQAKGGEISEGDQPPILSPTLGEIYIAQGRFEEAINVFQRLIEKEPQNTRYKRKIEDLQKILAKKQADG